ncbi:FIG00732463: hypothetical protein [Klebsiella pneumoniae IS46]|nr:FIG00732463: hypothetical protein [Klebsiella pneumoniae IS46]CDL42200.1 FIG00732463: hypothetical protein [Klebsiella pneumoniae ISC21]CDL61565.1 FIG00732463: hypothetical protein [Klebsiella pneumoniae IS39]
MVSNSFQQTTPKRRAAWLALLAILLIVVAPLISVSLQKRPHERHARHAPRHDDG